MVNPGFLSKCTLNDGSKVLSTQKSQQASNCYFETPIQPESDDKEARCKKLFGDVVLIADMLEKYIQSPKKLKEEYERVFKKEPKITRLIQGNRPDLPHQSWLLERKVDPDDPRILRVHYTHK